MIILKIEPESNGAHANQTWHKGKLPDGYIEIQEQFLSTWEQYKPFVKLSVENGAIVDMHDNAEARAAHAETEANQPSPPPTAEEDLMALTVDHEYRITLLELGGF